MSDSDLNKTLGFFAIICSVVVCLWFRGRIRLVKSTAQNSPIQGDPEDHIVMYGKLKGTTLLVHMLFLVCTSTAFTIQSYFVFSTHFVFLQPALHNQ